MQAANYTSRYAFYRAVYRVCSIKPLTPRALTDTGFYYVALATKSYKGLCSRSPVGAQQLRFKALSREPFSGTALRYTLLLSIVIKKRKENKTGITSKSFSFYAIVPLITVVDILILGRDGSTKDTMET